MTTFLSALALATALSWSSLRKTVLAGSLGSAFFSSASAGATRTKERAKRRQRTMVLLRDAVGRNDSMVSAPGGASSENRVWAVGKTHPSLRACCKGPDRLV